MNALLSTASATAGFGAPYPNATFISAVGHERCYTRYSLITRDPEDEVEAFYEAEGKSAHATMTTSRNPAIPDFRPLSFVHKPELMMFVMLDRNDGKTTVNVRYRTAAKPSC
ncbi:hypothetical protein KY084_09740 [Stakelama sp. CBK3Z-3]|uniref:Uncharacterized protein n=1 Tax=Stakelama flava TaxID=2860338 RepID=A0ABS6XLT1_9SPHN|nr:hypothetical protein [Stakelama flava]MBW4331151.1 hypothetical protein [Stakelama flava]